MNTKILAATLATAGVIGTGTAYGWSLNPSQWFQKTASVQQAADAAVGDGAASSITAPANATPLPTTAPAVVPPTTAPDYGAIVERFGPAVVGITVEGSRAVAQPNAPDLENDPFFRFYRGLPIPQLPRGEVPMRGQGSGFIVSADGLILTNAHVVRDADNVRVKLADRREFDAQVLGVDPATDVAVLKIDAKDLPSVQFGDPNRLRVGDYVLAIGSPFGFEQSATSGIVSAKGRSLPGDTFVPFIQTDVAVNPGNSGGPLFDAGGRVVGMNAQIYSRTGGYEGLSFAIPIDVALRVKDQVVSTGHARHALLGVTIQELNQALAESFQLKSPSGALIASVAPGSAAEKAGLRAGDVVLSVDGKPIARSGDLAAMVGAADPGQQVQLEVVRNGTHERFTAVLGEADAQQTAATGNDTREAPANEGRLGLAVRPLDRDERRAVNIATGGLVVEKASGAALRAGIEPGDVILSVNGQPVDSVDALRKHVDSRSRHLALLVQRGSTRIFVPLQLG